MRMTTSKTTGTSSAVSGQTTLLPKIGFSSSILARPNPWWAYFGLVGGGMYVYFAGRGIVVRLAMQRSGIRIGAPKTVKLYLVVLGLWGIIGLVTIAMAMADLPLPLA